MSFTGDLEHLSIVDVVQLLHTTRKSGTLTIHSNKGECQLVFDDGYIISANHFDNSLRIGRILVEAKVLTEEALNETLKEQKAAGDARRPLVATLIESGRVRKEDAYRGLETLLELTIVEVLTWKSGTFTLDVGAVDAADDYRYFPEKLQQDIQFHTENVLMDALRIYDEKKRDGTLGQVELTEEVSAPGGENDWSDVETEGGAAAAAGAPAPGISADDLGLGDVEGIKRRIPSVFKPLEDRSISPNRAALDRIASSLPAEARERLAAVLDAAPPSPKPAGPPLYALFFTADALLTHCLGAVCRQQGIFLFATNEESDVDPVLAQCRGRGGLPALVLDVPSAADPQFAPEALAALSRRLRERHGEMCALQLTGSTGFALPESADPEVVATLARPVQAERPASFVADLARFLELFPARLREHVERQRGWCVASLGGRIAELRDLKDPQAVPLTLLTALAAACGRALTLIVRGTELVPERGVGFVVAGGAAAATAREPRPLAGPPLRLAIGASPALTEAVGSGRSFWAPAEDPFVAQLWGRIGAPTHTAALLLPLRAGGRTVSLTYADFGESEPVAVDLGLFELQAALAGLALENILLRRKSEKPAPAEANPSTSRRTEGAPWT